jgi:hypothetical protein
MERSSCWHEEYIDFIFKNVPHQHVNDYAQAECYDNCYVIVGTQHGVRLDPTAYLKRMRENNRHFGILHLCDEWYQDDRSYYEYADVVLRHHYVDAGPKVHTFTVGWNKGYPYTTVPKPISERTYTWSFSGHIDKTTRADMVRNMNTVPNGKSFFKICGEPGPHDGYALSPAMMAEMFNDTIFVPCPQGNFSIETCRLCEALQMGALPIVERNEYWTNLFGDHPLIQIDSWDQVPSLINELLNDPEALELKRQQTYNWWIGHLASLQEKVVGLL